jgi:hypothetical protein
MRLKIQSLNEQPIQVQNVIVNDNADCSANPLAKLSAALKAEGRHPGLLERIPPTSSVTATMKYGDVATVPLFGCEPVRVRVVTERGRRSTRWSDCCPVVRSAISTTRSCAHRSLDA